MKPTLLRMRVLIIFVFVSFAFFLGITHEVYAQDDMVAQLRTELVQRGVPVKSIEILNRVPFELDVKVQSKSSTRMAEPEDALFDSAVHRQVALTRARGSAIDQIRVTFLNSQGAPIFWSYVPVRQVQLIKGHGLDNAATEQLLRKQLPVNGMSLTDLSVREDRGGGQVVQAHLSAQDLQVANSALPQFMADTPALLRKLNTEKAAGIAILKVELTTGAGEELLKYVYDLQLDKENWWQADGLTHDWFSEPLASNGP